MGLYRDLVQRFKGYINPTHKHKSSLIIKLILNNSSSKVDPLKWMKARLFKNIENQTLKNLLGKEVPRVNNFYTFRILEYW